MSMSTRHIATLCLGTLGALALSSMAFANVRHTVSGTECHYDNPGYHPTTMIDRSEFLGLQWSDPNEVANDIRTFWCPMTRSLPLSTAGLSDLEIVLRGTREFDPATHAQVICTAYSLRNDGTWAKIIEKQMPAAPRYTEASTGAVIYPITKMDFGSALNVGTNKGNYALRCWLPAGVSIYSIYHSEEDGIAGN
jgi:hypothetical protein